MNYVILTGTIVDHTMDGTKVEEGIEYSKIFENLDGAWTEYWEGKSDDITEKAAKITYNIAESMTDTSMGMVKEVVFKEYSGIMGSFSIVHTIAGSAALLVLLILIAKKGIQSMLNNASGGEYIPPAQIIIDTVRSCILAVALPWIMVLCLELLPKIGKLIFMDGFISFAVPKNSWDKFVSGDAHEFLESTETIKMYFNPTFWGFGLFMYFCLWLGNVCFLAKMCKFQVEMMFLDATALIAAVSGSSDKREFYDNWISTFKASLITVLANFAFYALMERCYYTLIKDGTTVICENSIIAIGAALCLIRGTIFTNRYKNGGFMGSALSGVTNAARSLTTLIPKI